MKKVYISCKAVQSIVKYDSHALYVLARFLEAEIYSFGSFTSFYTWLKSGTDGISGNAYELEEKDGKILVCEQEFLKVQPDDENDPLIFVTTRPQLRQILRRWGELMSGEKRPTAVIITQHDNGAVRLEGIYWES